MQSALRILCLDDSGEVAGVVLRELSRVRSAPEVRRVSSMAALADALAGAPPDIVVTAHRPAQAIHAPTVVAAVRERFPDLPVIVVDDGVDDETLVAALRAGAADVVRSERIIRLVPAVERGLAEAGDRRARRAADVMLRRRERHARLLLENSLDMLRLIAPDGTTLLETPAVERVFGWKPEELIGRDTFDFVHPDDLDEARRRFANVLAIRGRQEAMVMRGRHKDGSYRTIEVLEWSVVNEEGGVEVVVSSRDVTDRLAAEAALRKSEERFVQLQRVEALGRLAGGVAHDFNNHLTVILSFADQVAHSLPPGHPGHDSVAEIMRAGESAAALTRQLLAFSRKQVVKVEAVSIAEVLRGTQRMLRRLIGEAIELVVDPGPESLRVLADAGQLEQVVMNLAVNARDAMPEGGVLRIGAEEVLLDERDAAGPTPIEPGRWARLRVADTGCGMDESTLARIFEPFFTTKGPGIGTGLGLATVHGIVAQYGGAVRVRSAPGEGATFDVYLPAVEAPGAEREAAAAVSPFDARAGETLLVVEDDEAVLEVLRDVLEGARYRVVAARDGLAGIDAAAREPGRIHLVLTDVVMPRLSGPEMIARLSRTHPESRVLYMSGYIGESPSHRHLLDSGAALLQKPFLPDELLRRVREVLDAPRYG